MTDAKTGNSFLLKIADKYNSSVYTTIAALTANTLTINNTNVDITNKDAAGWVEAMPGGGALSVSLTADGIYTDDATQQTALDTLTSQIAATGTVTFGANPTDLDEFVFNGITWTFVASGASGNQTNIQGTKSGTMTQLAIDLNASGSGSLNVATYLATSTAVKITYDTIGLTGNTYTLADGSQGGANSTPDNATLTGGRDNDTTWNFQLLDGGGNTFTGAFHVDSFAKTGNVNEAETFSISLTSSGTITFA